MLCLVCSGAFIGVWSSAVYCMRWYMSVLYTLVLCLWYNATFLLGHRLIGSFIPEVNWTGFPPITHVPFIYLLFRYVFVHVCRFCVHVVFGAFLMCGFLLMKRIVFFSWFYLTFLLDAVSFLMLPYFFSFLFIIFNLNFHNLVLHIRITRI